MFDFASKIGGDRVEVRNIVPSGIDPHDWEPTPNMIASLARADVFVYSGAGMEHWVHGVLGGIDADSLISVETSYGIELLEASHTDPHVWLDPMNAKQQMQAIKEALIEANPNSREYFEDNFRRYASALDELDREFRQALEPFYGESIVVAHAAFGYLGAAYGINQVGVEGGGHHHSEPDPARMSEIIDFIRENEIGTIFLVEDSSSRVVEVLAEETGARTAVLNPMEKLSEASILAGDDYFSIMRQNLQALLQALEG